MWQLVLNIHANDHSRPGRTGLGPPHFAEHVAGCIRMMTSKLSACLIHSLCSSDIKGQERKSNKQTTYCCHIIHFCCMALVHVHLFNHGDPKRWCYQVHHLQLWSTEVKTLLKAAQRVKQSLLSLCLLNSRAHELP